LQIARIWAARLGVGSKATTIAGVSAAASHEKTPMFAPTSNTGADPRSSIAARKQASVSGS
jgi:hypothetical protein